MNDEITVHIDYRRNGVIKRVRLYGDVPDPAAVINQIFEAHPEHMIPGMWRIKGREARG